MSGTQPNRLARAVCICDCSGIYGSGFYGSGDCFVRTAAQGRIQEMARGGAQTGYYKGWD